MTTNADPSYQPLIYKLQGGNIMVVAAGGTLEIAGTLQVDVGALIGFGGVTPITRPASANEAAVGSIAPTFTWDGATVFPSAADGTAINAAIAALKTLVNQLRADLVALGLIKGSA